MVEFLLWGMAPASALCLLLFVIFAASTLKVQLRSPKPLAIAFAVAALATGFIFLFCRSEFRVLNDETSFLNVANALLTTGKANSFPEWIWKGKTLVPYFEQLTFRPVLFPALLTIPCLLLGTCSVSGFLLNFFVTILIFSGVFLWASRIGQFPLGALGVLLLALNPLVAFSATSSGYDLLSLFFFLATILSWIKYSKEESARNLGLTIFAAACFASTRIEGALAFGIISLIAILSTLKKRSFPPLLFVLLAVLLVIPVLLQRAAYYPHIDLETVDGLASWKYFLPNLKGFLFGFLLNPLSPLPIFTHALGLIFIWSNRAKWRRRESIAPILFLGIYFIFLLCFHDGNLESPHQARLFLPFSTLLSLGAAKFIYGETRPWVKRAGMGLIAIQLLVSFQVIRAGVLFFEAPYASEFRAIQKFMVGKDKKAAYIYLNPGPITAFGFAAIQPKTFDRNREWFRKMLEEEKLGPVYLIEAWPPNKSTRPASLSANETHLLMEEPLGNLRTLRFLEVNISAASLAPALE